MSLTIMLISSEAPTRSALARRLREAEMRVLEHRVGNPVAAAVLQEPDIVLVDSSGSLTHALEVCRDLSRQRIVVAAMPQASEQLELLFFHTGVRDVVITTTSPELMVARIRALVPETGASRGTLSVGGVELDRDARRVSCGGRSVPLNRTEYALLEVLMERPTHVIERSELMRLVWGDACSTHAFDSAVSRLRCKIKLSGGPRIAIPMRRVGYRLGIG